MANVDPDGQRLPRLPVGQHVVNYESHEVVTLEDGTRMFVVELLCEQSTVQSAIGGRFKTLEFIDTKYAANGGRERQWGKVASLCKSLLGAYFDASWAQEMLVEPYETPKLNGAKYQVTTSPKVTKSQVKTDATGEPQTYDAFTRIG